MAILRVVLLVAAFICFLLATVGTNAKINLLALGLACWILTLILTIQ